MPSSTRTTLSLILVLSLAAVGIAVLLLALPRIGLTAHFYVPRGEWLEMPPLAPSLAGLPTQLELEPGFERSVWQGLESSGDADHVERGVRHVGVEAGQIGNVAAPFVSEWRGYLQALQSGVYEFEVSGNHQIAVSLNGTRVISTNSRVLKESDAVRIPLEVGLHAVRIEYIAPVRRAEFSIRWTPPGGEHFEEFEEAPVYAPSEPEGWRRWAEHAQSPPLSPSAAEEERWAPGHLLARGVATIVYPRAYSLNAAYLMGWDYDRFAFPNDFPGYAVVWKGKIRIPAQGRYAFDAKSNGRVRISVDGKLLEGATAGPLSEGWHDFA